MRSSSSFTTEPVRGDVMGSYRSKLAGTERLDAERERELARRFKAGDRRAGEQLVTGCLPFVIAIAVEYRRWGLPLEDLVQQGNLGLLRAAQKFDPERDVRLATYAAFWIRAEIRDLVVRAYRVVRIGTTKAERRALRAYRTQSARDVDSLAAASGLSPERVERLLPVLAAGEVSLDAPLGEDGPQPLELIPADGPTPEDIAEADQTSERTQAAVSRALVRLSGRERMIVEERYLTEEPVTLQELGTRLGVSKERVRQLEERAKRKLASELDAALEAPRARSVATR